MRPPSTPVERLSGSSGMLLRNDVFLGQMSDLSCIKHRHPSKDANGLKSSSSAPSGLGARHKLPTGAGVREGTS